MSQENVERVERSLDSLTRATLMPRFETCTPRSSGTTSASFRGRPFTTAGKPPQSTFAPRSELSPDTAWTRRSSCT